jgi:hypothetical protein
MQSRFIHLHHGSSLPQFSSRTADEEENRREGWTSMKEIRDEWDRSIVDRHETLRNVNESNATRLSTLEKKTSTGHLLETFQVATFEQ